MTPEPWGPRRLAALTLAIGLAVLLAVGLALGSVDLRRASLLGVGVALGGWFALRGGLPSWLYEGNGTILDAFRPNLNRDDDPGNISPRVYLPILLALVVVGVAAFALILSR